MNQAAELQQKMALMRQKNDEFFKQHEPIIYDIIKDKTLAESAVNIVPMENGELEIDVLERGAYRYFGKGIYYSEQEAEKFLGQYADGKTINSLAPPPVESFVFNRTASNHLKQLTRDLQPHIHYGAQYPIDGFIPFLVIMGVGLGFHIEKIVTERRLGSVIIYENNLDRFITSLYTVDWSSIYAPFMHSENGSLQVVLSYSQIKSNHKAALWNELIKYVPHFPFSTVIYNHLSDPLNTEIISSIQSDVMTFTHQWGHFDDELNQYNNARHNLLEGTRVFLPSRFTANPHIPVAIIGGGPSLEGKIDVLRKYRDKMLLISCGTSIGTLCEYDLKPHIHIELESDLITYEAIEKSTTPAFRDGILLLAAAQVNPLVGTLFEKKCMYFKDSSSLSALFLKDPKDVVYNVTPTCTNAGVALAVKMGFNQIFLIGTDYGFLDPNKHHAPGSIYYQQGVSKPIEESNDFSKHNLVETTSVLGEKMWTKPMYFTAKRRVEETIKYYFKKGKRVNNASDGAVINNAPWVSTDKMRQILERTEVGASPEDLVTGLIEFSGEIDHHIIDDRSESMIEVVSSMLDVLIKSKPKTTSTFDISTTIFKANNRLSREFVNKLGARTYFIRGHIWIFLMLYYTYSLLAKSDEDRLAINTYARKWLEEDKKQLLHAMREIMFHKRPVTEDPWVIKPFDRHG
ncbi:MAG: motility associated factor glycosyltransferase family protein [Saccharospirillum sp.]